MWQMRYQKVSTWDVAYAVDMAIAWLITYWVVAFFLPNLAGRRSTSVGILWAVISTVFVYKDTRSHSLSAGISRLIATMISLILCLFYLLLFPITSFGMAALIFYRHVGHDIDRATRRDWPDGNYNCCSHDCCGERLPIRLAATIVALCRYSRWNYWCRM
jgi:hypothetical protein